WRSFTRSESLCDPAAMSTLKPSSGSKSNHRCYLERCRRGPDRRLTDMVLYWRMRPPIQAMKSSPKTGSTFMRKTEPTHPPSPSDQLLIQAFAQLDPTALGVALGATCGLAIFFATNFVILKGGENVGQNLQLLSQYFLGYSVTLTGSIIGFAYGLIVGFVLG